MGRSPLRGEPAPRSPSSTTASTTTTLGSPVLGARREHVRRRLLFSTLTFGSYLTLLQTAGTPTRGPPTSNLFSAPKADPKSPQKRT